MNWKQQVRLLTFLKVIAHKLDIDADAIDREIDDHIALVEEAEEKQ